MSNLVFTLSMKFVSGIEDNWPGSKSQTTKLSLLIRVNNRDSGHGMDEHSWISSTMLGVLLRTIRYHYEG
jgi:hypothetical protein